MPENIKNDWLVASASKPDFSLGDFEQMGLTPDNTQLLSARDYEKNDKIQKLFTNPETGKFDKDQFNSFYDVATQTFNDFAKKEYDSTVLNQNYFFKENFHAPKDARRFQSTVDISKVKNPFNQKQGVEGFTTKTDSGLSVREIAQTQKVQDFKTGKELDFTPNEAGFFGSLFKPTAVLAAWDTDGEHYDADLGRKVKHSKGEFKYNANGKNYYETLGTREVYGKEALSSWDVLTEDGSAANKWDFMDGDSLNKTLTGTVFKTVAQVLPHLIPGVGQWYTGITVGNALLTDLLPVLGKATGGLFLGDALQDTDFFKSMNQLQGFGKRFQTSISDEGKQSTFNKENLFAMAGDVFGQLAQQQLIARIPIWLGQTGKEAQLFEKYAAKYGEEGLANIKNTLKSFKGNDAIQARANYLRNTLGADTDLLDVMEKWDKWGSVGAKSLGIAYMSGISATSVSEEAKLHGLDEKDTSMLFLGTMAGFGAMMTKLQFAHWAIHGIGLDELGGFLKKAVREEVKLTAGSINKIANAIGDDVLKAGTRAGDNIVADIATGGAEATKTSARAKLISLFNKGKEIGKKIGDQLGDLDTFKSKMLAESLEETTEEAMQDGIKAIYNGMRSLGFTSTDKEKSQAFSFEDMSSRYMMSALGGAMGGGIAAVQQKLAGRMYEELPESLTKDFASIARHGYTDAAQRVLDKMRDDGKFGSKTLSITQHEPDEALSNDPTYLPMSAVTDGMSHNDFIYNVLSSQLKLAQNTIVQEGIDGDVRLNDIYAERADMYMDIKHNTAIVDDIDNITSQIIKLKAEEAIEEGGVKEGTNAEDSAIAKAGASTKKKIADLKEELLRITSGERAVDYLGEALFSVNRQLNEAFGIENRDTIAYRDYQKKYDNLNATEKADVDDTYAKYKEKDKRQQVRMRKGEFDELKNGDFNTLLPTLEAYGLQRKGFLKDFTDIPTAIFNIKQGIADYTTSMGKLTINSEEDVDKIDNNSLGQLNLGTVVEQDPGKSDIQVLADYVRGEQYLNPVMLEFVKRNYDKALKVNEPFADIYQEILDPLHINAFSVSPETMATETGVPVDQLLKDLSSYNYTETMEKLRDVVNTPGFTTMANLNYDDYDNAIDPKALADAYLQAIDAIEMMLKFDSVVDENGVTTLLPKEGAQETIDSLDYIKSEYARRPQNPLFEYISNLTKREGRNDLSNLIQIINSEFSNLSKKSAANDFVIDNKISQEQLEYGRQLLEKINAVFQASVDYSGYAPDTQGIGYNAAMNAIAKKNGTEEFEPLNTISADAGSAITMDLAWLGQKINFLLNLNEFNSNGSIRELKLTGAAMSTLYLNSISQGTVSYNALESAGVDMSGINDALDKATQFRRNMESIDSPEDAKIPLQSTDEAFFKIREERDAVEQAIYSAINSREDKVQLINDILDAFPLAEYALDNNTMDFKSTVKHLPRGQQLIYLAQSITIDPKAFYKDFVGDLSNGEDLLAGDPYAPFYGQEHVIKQMYWHLMSKMSPVDTHRKVANILMLPESSLTDLQKNEINTLLGGRGTALDVENFHKLKNATVLYGMPGAGKTTSALYYITKMAERYGMNAAIFAPHEEQGANLKESLKDRKNVYNEAKSVSSIIDTVLGSELLDKVRGDYRSKNFASYDVSGSLAEVDPKSTLMLKTFNGNSTIVLNPNNVDVAKFLKDETKVLAFEGKVPRLIIIDEATHVPTVELMILNQAIERHNNNSKDNPISLFLVGDREQRGNNIKLGNNIMSDNITANTLMMATPVLSQSLRNRFNIKNKNINAVRALRKTFETATTGANPNIMAANKMLNDGIKFEYENSELYGLVGEKIVREFTKEDIESLFRTQTDNVALITDRESPALLALIKSIPGAYERLKVFNPDKVQGLEYDGIIIDITASDKKPSNLGETNEAYSAMEMLYTMISRSKKGSLIKAPFIASIGLTSTNEDVFAQKIELDKNQIERYKEFTLAGIGKSFEKLQDIEPSVVKPETKTTQETTEADNENTDVVFETLNEELGKEGDDNPQDIQTTSGEEIPQDLGETRPLSYTFHERLGFKVGSDNKIEGEVDHTKDLGFIYSVMNQSQLKQGDLMSSDRIIRSRKILETLKASIINYAKISKETVADLANFLSMTRTFEPRLLNSLKFHQAKFKLVTKEYDPKTDLSFKHRTKQGLLKGGGLISYLVMEVPHYDGTLIDLTMAALPNPNNPNVAKLQGVMKSIADIKQLHQANAVKGVSSIYLDPELRIYDVLSPTANLTIRRKDVPTITYKQFRDDNSHFNMSVPHIIMNSDIISEDDEVVQEFFANFNRGGVKADGNINKGSSFLIGKPVVFVSYDKNIPRNELPDRYRRQLNAQLQQRLAGKPVDPGTIRMVILNKQGMAFKDWLNKNISLTRQQLTTEVDVKAQRRAYSNNFAAANMLASFINFKRRAEYYKANPEAGKTLRESLGLPANKYTPATLNKLIMQMDQIIKTSLPMLTGRTFEEIYVGAASSTEEALQNYIEKSKATVDSYLADVFQGDSRNRDKAVEHFLAQDILKSIKRRGEVEPAYRQYTIAGEESSLKIENSALYDMVSSIRLSMVGGVLTSNTGDKIIVDGILQSALVTGSTDAKEFDTLLTNIDDIIKPAFPDGIHINPVLRTIGNEGRYQGNAPFVVPSGNVDGDFKVNVEIQLPTIYFNPESLATQQPAPQTNSRQTEFEPLLVKVSSVIDELVANGKGVLQPGDFVNVLNNLRDSIENTDTDLNTETAGVMTELANTANNVLATRGSNIISIGGAEFIIQGVNPQTMKLEATSLQELGTKFAKDSLVGKVDNSNILVSYSTKNTPGTTDKVREFLVTDAGNGDIIATFVHDNKTFNSFNLLAPVKIDTSSLPPVFAGTPLENDFNIVYSAINDPSLAPIDAKELAKFSMKYFKLGKFLKTNNFNLEFETLDAAYKELIKQIKC